MRRQLAALCRWLAVLLGPAAGGAVLTVERSMGVCYEPREEPDIGNATALLSLPARWDNPLMWWPEGGPCGEPCVVEKLDSLPAEMGPAPPKGEAENRNDGDGKNI